LADLGDFTALYDGYIDTVKRLERERKPGAGIFGLPGGPADDPCHDRFAEELKGLVAAFAAEEPASDRARAVLAHIYTVPLGYRELRSAYWMLTAVHGLALDLIPFLSPADAAALYEEYAKSYPRWERLPVQKQTLAALKARR